MRKRVGVVHVLLFLVAAVSVSAPAAAQVDAPTGSAAGAEALPEQAANNARLERFQDWTVRCETVANDAGSAEVCEMIQQVTMEETDETVMEVAVGFVPERAFPIALFTVPLGIRIPPGLLLRVDSNETVRINIEICSQEGCFASMNFDENMLAQFRAGATGTLQIRDPRGQSFDLPISLMGFTAALRRISP